MRLIGRSIGPLKLVFLCFFLYEIWALADRNRQIRKLYLEDPGELKNTIEPPDGRCMSDELSRAEVRNQVSADVSLYKTISVSLPEISWRAGHP